MGPSDNLDHWGSVVSAGGEQASESCRVGSRRHRQDAQLGSHRRGDLEDQRQAEVGRQVALVDLVEDHGGDAGKFRVSL